MTDTPVPSHLLQEALAGLPGVRVRRMFGADAYFATGVLFAFLAEEGLVLRLSAAAKSAAIESGLARNYLGRLPEGLSGWVVVSYDTQVKDLIESAHLQAQAVARTKVRRRASSARARRARRKKS